VCGCELIHKIFHKKILNFEIWLPFMIAQKKKKKGLLLDQLCVLCV
jgi:hypothetical protein